MNKYLEFSIDYSGNIESIDEFSINNEIVEINDEMEVQTLIDKLTRVEGFHLSENRTEVRIWWNQNKTMDVRYRDYTEPDWNVFDDYQLLNLPTIDFEPKMI